MVLTIKTDGVDRFSFDLAQEDVIFLLNYAKEHAIDVAECQIKEKEVADTPEESIEIQKPKKYKGFLLIKCESCGEVKGFCAKEPIDSYYCKSCGSKTPLEDMKVLYEDCECGMHYKYMTNQTEDFVTHECLSCGEKNTMVLNSRRTAYVTRKQKIEANNSMRKYIQKYEPRRKQAI